MKTTWIAGACAALALLAVPVAGALAQSASQAPEQSGQSAMPAAGLHAGAEMLGKKVKLRNGQTVGEISDVIVSNGKPTEAVIELEKQNDKPVLITIISLSPQGSDYVLSMTEAQLAQAPEFKGPSSGQTSLQSQQAQGGTKGESSGSQRANPAQGRSQ